MPVRRFALLAVLGVLLLAPAAGAQAPARTISVTGDALLRAANDTARVGFRVKARGPTSAKALRRSSARLRKVVGALGILGIRGTDLRTGRVRVARRRGRRGRKLPGFVASSGVTTVVRDVERTGAAIDAAVLAGASSVSGPSFFIFDPAALRRRALVRALRDARAKAVDLAAEAGLTLGKPISIRESTFVDSLSDFDREGGEGFTQEGRAFAPAPTRPGRTQVAGTVYVVFEAE